MTPKLLLALALVGAMHAGEPFKLGPTMTNSGPIVLSHTTKDGNIDVDTTMTFPDVFVGKIVVRREPTVTRKADGMWEITFAGKASLPALTVPMTPEVMAQVVAPDAAPVPAPLISGHRNEPEAASKIMPPAKPTVEWIGNPVVSDDDKYTPSTGWIKNREIGLRSDGCVIWRERK